jgi:drug/metabolite transporter (DMT)-like permease
VPGRPRTLLAVLAVVAAGACWGFSAVIATTAFDRGVAPVRMAEARVLIALVVLAAILALRAPALMRPPRAAWPAFVAFGLSIAVVNAAYYVAIDRLPVGVAISIQYTAPTLLLALSAVLASAGVRSSVLPAPASGPVPWVAAGITLVGAALVSEAFAGLGGLSASGLAAAAVSAVTFGTYLVSARWAAERGSPPATTLLWGFAVACAAWTVVAPWWGWPVGLLDEPAVLGAVVAVGLLATLLPFFLSVWAVRILSPATVGVAATVKPPFATFFAWVFLGQALSGWQLFGAALVVGGVVLAQRASTPGAETVVEPAV